MKGAIFDVDGTLLDSMKIWDSVATRYLTSIAVLPEENVDQTLSAMSMEEGATYLKKHYRLEKTEKEIIEGVFAIMQAFYEKEVLEKEGVRELLQCLSQKGIRMGIATTSNKEYVKAAFERLYIDQYFQFILTCSELQTSKKEPLIYEMAAKELGCKPQDTYVFEDAIHAVRTAKEAGFITVGVYDASSAEDETEIRSIADYYLKDNADIHKFIKGEDDEDSFNNSR